jgi:hypothetical protein
MVGTAEPKGISLHIGLNRVDPVRYGGWKGELVACENDACDMETIARRQGFVTHSLLTKAGECRAPRPRIGTHALVILITARLPVRDEMNVLALNNHT